VDAGAARRKRKMGRIGKLISGRIAELASSA
jgi:hypothetical protein